MPEEFMSVWDALEDSPEAAANMKARSSILSAVRQAVESWNVTQTEAARRLNITQPRLNDLLQGRISKFSLDALLNLATRAGLSVEWKIGVAAA